MFINAPKKEAKVIEINVFDKRLKTSKNLLLTNERKKSKFAYISYRTV